MDLTVELNNDTRGEQLRMTFNPEMLDLVLFTGKLTEWCDSRTTCDKCCLCRGSDCNFDRKSMGRLAVHAFFLIRALVKTEVLPIEK